MVSLPNMFVIWIKRDGFVELTIECSQIQYRNLGCFPKRIPIHGFSDAFANDRRVADRRP